MRSKGEEARGRHRTWIIFDKIIRTLITQITTRPRRRPQDQDSTGIGLVTIHLSDNLLEYWNVVSNKIETEHDDNQNLVFSCEPSWRRKIPAESITSTSLTLVPFLLPLIINDFETMYG